MRTSGHHSLIAEHAPCGRRARAPERRAGLAAAGAPDGWRVMMPGHEVTVKPDRASTGTAAALCIVHLHPDGPVVPFPGPPHIQPTGTTIRLARLGLAPHAENSRREDLVRNQASRARPRAHRAGVGGAAALRSRPPHGGRRRRRVCATWPSSSTRRRPVLDEGVKGMIDGPRGERVQRRGPHQPPHLQRPGRSRHRQRHRAAGDDRRVRSGAHVEHAIDAGRRQREPRRADAARVRPGGRSVQRGRGARRVPAAAAPAAHGRPRDLSPGGRGLRAGPSRACPA